MMTDEQMRKCSFVENELKKLLMRIDLEIWDVTYDINDFFEEFVTIEYEDSRRDFKVCVTADSLSALTLDVLKAVSG